VHKARRIQVAEVGSSISDIIQEALSLLFLRELKGIAVFDARIGHHNVGYAEFRQPLLVDGILKIDFNPSLV